MVRFTSKVVTSGSAIGVQATVEINLLAWMGWLREMIHTRGDCRGREGKAGEELSEKHFDLIFETFQGF
jgi:hypothetical protein